MSKDSSSNRAFYTPSYETSSPSKMQTITRFQTELLSEIDGMVSEFTAEIQTVPYHGIIEIDLEAKFLRLKERLIQTIWWKET